MFANSINPDVIIAMNVMLNASLIGGILFKIASFQLVPMEFYHSQVPTLVAFLQVIVGSRYVGDNRYAAFWALKKGIIMFTAVAMIFGIAGYFVEKSSLTGSLSNPGTEPNSRNNLLHVNCLVGNSPCAQVLLKIHRFCFF